MNLGERLEVVQEVRLLQQAKPLFLDTETTGTGPNAEIIEIALVDSLGSLVFDSLVKPRGKIEVDATRIHGITEEMVQDAPEWGEVWTKIEPILQGQRVGAYNSDFDLRMLKQSHKRYWMNWRILDEQFFCVMKLYARFAGNWDARRRSYRWQSLENAGQQCLIQMPNSHRARDDARLARAVFEHMANWKS